jgi:hypothetical protein
MLRYCVCLLLVLAAVPGLAQTRPRDAVMSGSYRCGAVGAPRQWLDCYYGAAQPARSALGLPPAPQTQIQLSLSPPPSNAGPRIAQIREEVMAAALRCYAGESDRAWLDCYYAAAAPMRNELGLTPGPQVASVPGPVPIPQAPQQPDRFGLKELPATRANHVSTRMVSYSFDHNRIFTVTLTNGQTWRQVSGDTHTAHWAKPAGAYAVKITRGSFSSYDFQVEGSPEVYKVDRVG